MSVPDASDAIPDFEIKTDVPTGPIFREPKGEREFLTRRASAREFLTRLISQGYGLVFGPSGPCGIGFVIK